VAQEDGVSYTQEEYVENANELTVAAQSCCVTDGAGRDRSRDTRVTCAASPSGTNRNGRGH